MFQLGFWLVVIGLFAAVSAFEIGVALIGVGTLAFTVRLAWWYAFEVF